MLLVLFLSLQYYVVYETVANRFLVEKSFKAQHEIFSRKRLTTPANPMVYAKSRIFFVLFVFILIFGFFETLWAMPRGHTGSDYSHSTRLVADMHALAYHF